MPPVQWIIAAPDAILLSGAGRDCGPVGDSAVAPAIAVLGAAFGRAYPGSTCPAPPLSLAVHKTQRGYILRYTDFRPDTT
jgi:hypothetical protein